MRRVRRPYIDLKEHDRKVFAERARQEELKKKQEEEKEPTANDPSPPTEESDSSAGQTSVHDDKAETAESAPDPQPEEKPLSIAAKKRATKKAAAKKAKSDA